MAKTGDPIEVLERRGYDTKSWIGVVQDYIVRTKESWTAEDHSEMISELLSEKVIIENQELARITATYFIQELMKMHNDSELNVDPDAAYYTAHMSAEKYVDRMDNGDLQYLRAKSEDSDENLNAEPVIDDRGNRKRKKGAKKEMASKLYRKNYNTKTRAEMIAIFMEDIGMSKAGATTYFHNNRKEFGPCKEA